MLRAKILNSLHNMGLTENLSIYLENLLTNREIFVKVKIYTQDSSSRKREYPKEAS